MTPQQTISWIFLSTAVASQSEPAQLSAISSAADAINRAVPTAAELQSSITWLVSKELIAVQNDTYTLTSKGKAAYKEASKKTSVLFKIWDRLDVVLQKYDA